MKRGEIRKIFFTIFFAITIISAAIPLMAENKSNKEEDYTAIGAWEGASAAKSNYAMYCSPCHGETGKGDGPQADAMEVPPRNHTDGNYLSTRTDEQLFKVVREGGPSIGFSSSMPPFNYTLKDEEIKDIVKYVRTLCNCQYKKIGVSK